MTEQYTKNIIFKNIQYNTLVTEVTALILKTINKCFKIKCSKCKSFNEMTKVVHFHLQILSKTEISAHMHYVV